MPVGAEILVKIPSGVSSDKASLLRRRLIEDFGAHLFYGEGADDDFLPLAPLKENDCEAPDGNYEGWLHLHVLGSIYQPGYERGNPWNYIALAEWLEHNILGAKVFYGADGSDNHQLFDEVARKKLINYFCEHGYSYHQRAKKRLENKESEDV